MDKYKDLEQRILFLEAIAGILDSPIANKALEIFQEEFKKNIARRKQSEPQPLTDQIKAIPWAKDIKYVAHDEDGMWWKYGGEPTLHERDECWDFAGTSDFIRDVHLPTFEDWRESKVRVNE